MAAVQRAEPRRQYLTVRRVAGPGGYAVPGNRGRHLVSRSSMRRGSVVPGVRRADVLPGSGRQRAGNGGLSANAGSRRTGRTAVDARRGVGRDAAHAHDPRAGHRPRRPGASGHGGHAVPAARAGDAGTGDEFRGPRAVPPGPTGRAGAGGGRVAGALAGAGGPPDARLGNAAPRPAAARRAGPRAAVDPGLCLGPHPPRLAGGLGRRRRAVRQPLPRVARRGVDGGARRRVRP